MKIKKIELKDYKVFKGKRVFKFSDRLNLISGPNGSGKTILFNALRESIISEVLGVKISLEGEIDDFKNNLELIFIDEEQIRKSADAIQSLTNNMSLGDRSLLAFISILLRRVALKKNLPLVVDAHLFAILDLQNRDLLLKIMLALKTQIILFEHDFKGIKGDKEYHLGIRDEN